MARLSAYGLTVELPAGWDGRLFGRDIAGGSRAALHAATFPLPAERGDFGSGAVDLMGPDDVLVVVLEYDPAQAGRGLFAGDGLPVPLDSGAFTPGALQRAIAGQAGLQSFFSVGDRAFCLYVVIGQASTGGRDRPVERANDLLRGLTVG